MINRIIFTVLDVLIVIIVCSLFKKIIKIASKNKKQMKYYSKSVIVGIVSAVVVIILDRGIDIFLANIPRIQWEIWSFFDGFIRVLFNFGLLILLVLFILYIGIKSLPKK